MDISKDLPAAVPATSTIVHTHRLAMHITQSGDMQASPVVFIHGNFSSSVYFTQLIASLPKRYRYIAIDLRGYGFTEDVPIDARRGARDWSDDLRALFDELDLGAAHMLGWSLGAAVAMQFALDHAEAVQSLSLVAPVSPFGFGGTCDNLGRPCYPDHAGSGAGLVNPEFVKRIAQYDRSGDSEFSPRNVLQTLLVHPPCSFAGIEDLLTGSFRQKLGLQRYPGDAEVSGNWPFVGPGKWGPLNALSGKYFNVSAIVDLPRKPPVLWLRGDKDLVVSDQSLSDIAVLGKMQLVPGWPGMKAFPPQPMVSQMRSVLQQYRDNGGEYQEVVFANTGHSPFLEKLLEFRRSLLRFLDSVNVQ